MLNNVDGTLGTEVVYPGEKDVRADWSVNHILTKSETKVEETTKFKILKISKEHEEALSMQNIIKSLKYKQQGMPSE